MAQALGISLSELYTAALTAYVTTHPNGGVTEALNRVYDEESSTLDPALVRIQLASVGDETWSEEMPELRGRLSELSGGSYPWVGTTTHGDSGVRTVCC